MGYSVICIKNNFKVPLSASLCFWQRLCSTMTALVTWLLSYYSVSHLGSRMLFSPLAHVDTGQ